MVDEPAANSWLNGWRKWLRPDPKPLEPDQPPAPEPTNDPKMADYLKVMRLLRQIDFKKLLPVFLTVPALVFFAISGLIAWLAVLCGFFIRIARSIAGLFWRK